MSAALAAVINIEQKRAEYMGTPQLDDGHVRIANELFEAILKFPFSSRQLKVMMAIIRKTYGFNKKADKLAQSQIAELCNMAKPHVCTTLKELAAIKAIEVDSTGYTHTISINKKYMEWESYQNGNSYQIGNSNVTKTVTKPLPKRELQKTKDNTKDKDSADKKPSAAVSLKTWLEKIKAEGDTAIRSDDPIFGYAEKIGVTDDMLRLCWLGFKRQFMESSKRQKDWRSHFRNAVRGNWIRVWGINAEGQAYLTTTGRQLAKEFEGVEA